MSARIEPEGKRSPQARALAERALIDLVRELDGTGVELIVLGGLVPEVLTEGQEPPAPPHLGTADVDLLLRTSVAADEDLGALESALGRLDFKPVGEPWRWRGVVRGRVVRIEFLCDVETEPNYEDVELRGCETLKARNLRGTGYVALDWTTVTLAAETENGLSEARVRFARLGGFLMSKCAAARTRAKQKDFYDLVYVLVHNRAGGPVPAAEAVLAREPLCRAVTGELRNTLIEVRARFASPTQAGPAAFAAQSILVDPASNEAALKAEAVAAAREFFDVLLRRASG